MSDRASTWLFGTLSAAGGALVAIVVATLWLGQAKANADEAKKATDDLTPRVVRVETKVEGIEDRVKGMDKKVDELLRRVPPR